MKLSIGIASMMLALSAHAGDVVRYPLPGGSKFPIASAVEVPAGTTLIFQSGALASPKDPSAPAGTAAYWGDTKTQALSALDNIKKALESEGVGFGDVVKMLVFLVGDPATDLLAHMVTASRHAHWLNPEPKHLWGSGDSAVPRYQEVITMHECRSAKQLATVIDALLPV